VNLTAKSVFALRDYNAGIKRSRAVHAEDHAREVLI
jgi:hypothetical protein